MSNDFNAEDTVTRKLRTAHEEGKAQRKPKEKRKWWRLRRKSDWVIALVALVQTLLLVVRALDGEDITQDAMRLLKMLMGAM